MTKGKTTRRRVTWAALPAERQDYWQAFLRTLPKRIVSAFRRGIVLFEMKPNREARGWARTLAREFTLRRRVVVAPVHVEYEKARQGAPTSRPHSALSQRGPRVRRARVG